MSTLCAFVLDLSWGIHDRCRDPDRGVSTAAGEGQDHAAKFLRGHSDRLPAAQQPPWDVLSDRYFRVEAEGWEWLPDGPSRHGVRARRWFADLGERAFGLKRRLRGATVPIIAGVPFPLALEILPARLPLPVKIRTELLDPIHLDPDPRRADDADYANSIYHRVESAIQAGVERLATRRRFPIFF